VSALLSGEELADLAGLSAVTIRRYARDGLIPARVSPGGHRKYEAKSALEALDRLRRRIRVESDALPASNPWVEDTGEFPDAPPTPRGAFVHIPVRVTISPVSSPCSPVMTPSEWNELVLVLDEQF
jgi:MerR family regulatory protein